jgi:hypothetical protein
MRAAILEAAVRVSAGLGTRTGRGTRGLTAAADATLPAHCRSPDLFVLFAAINT